MDIRTIDRPATNLKEYFTAMLYMYENNIDWCQHGTIIPYDYDNVSEIESACLIGCSSLVLVEDEPIENKALKDKAYKVMKSEIGLVSYWNDTPGRTKEDVIAFLKSMITKY